ncbi:MAG: nitroreductase family protein [Rhodococcus sp. (in: high G+C Gram-positive bacteria)]|uniref:nitroreductase family protein n=1 Tax=Rhodococcus sp. EPR-157 TaxID=1813677 RepID=UPI0007BB68E0|nr:nitroreductase family protein [Rhodococcus sp. EPR-157]KZF07332.1 nitroreductase [Rhodococcus sp. EPR-157]
MNSKPVTSVADAIKSRRSHRHYLPTPIPDDVLDRLLELALEAPSAWNYQGRSIVVASEPEVRAELENATGGQPHPREAPVVLVFLAELNAWRRDNTDIFDEALRNRAWSEQFAAGSAESSRQFQQDLVESGLEREYAVKDAVIAASFAMLVATELGLACSPMNGWNEAQVKKAIGIDDRDDIAVALLLPIGFAAEQRRHPGRRPMSAGVHFQQYRSSIDTTRRNP